ncbi:ArsR/SmtB family transcription factor [Actinomadura sp. 6N118]|uniref:ArsR/SmtB family transcription factor n=1 Tax=Actinomadura sp. 6N118 TaxID=3375151 RepID=UPI0037B6A5C5
MLRIHFTPDDLLRIRITAAADPLWETMLALQKLRTSTGGLDLTAWRRQVRAQIQRDERLLHAVRLLAPLMPPTGYVPDFLTPPESGLGLEPGIDAVAATPRRRLRNELARLAESGPVPPDFAALAAGDTEKLRDLTDALRIFHTVALSPHWDRVQAHVRADQATRAHALSSHGAERLLDGFETMRWRPPVLEANYPVDRDLRLNGRGLLLAPSMFCWRVPISLADPALPPILVYPVGGPAGWLTARIPGALSDQNLGALLGHTRAAILEILAKRQYVTGEIARLTATSPATASKHTTVLRDAGLIISIRSGRHVVHQLTPLGTALLNGGLPARTPIPMR